MHIKFRRTSPRLASLRILLPSLLAWASLTSPGSTQTPIAEHDGTRSGDTLGWSVDLAGDVDRDGVADLIVGAREGEYAQVLSGRNFIGGEGERVLFTFRAPEDRVTDDFFGQSVAGVGDLDRDGHDDVAVGAPLSDINGANSGGVYVYSGRTGNLMRILAGFGREFGSKVCGVGDATGDGIPDIAVSAPVDVNHPTYRAGRVFLFSGYDIAFDASGRQVRAIYTVQGLGEYDLLGSSLAAAGDVDGDGHRDLILGAPESYPPFPNLITEGYALVVSGRTGGVLSTLRMETPGRLGTAVAGVGDLDGDGFDDVAASAPNASTLFAQNSGIVWIYSGRSLRPGSTPTILRSLQGQTIGETLGRSLANVGDIDHDSFDDLIVGGRSVTADGFAQVISGRTLDPITSRLTAGPDRTNQQSFGFSVCGAGDLNRDGLADFVVSTPEDSTEQFLSGSIAAYSGTTGLELTDPGTAIAGSTLEISLESDLPDQDVALIFGTNPGPRALPGCRGLKVDIRNPRLVGSYLTDDAGSARFRLSIPDHRRGETVYLQLVSVEECRVSNRLELHIQ